MQRTTGVVVRSPKRGPAWVGWLRGQVWAGTVFPLGLLVALSLAGSDGREPKLSGSVYPCLKWEVKEGLQANRQRTERLYKAACGWVEQNVWPKGETVRPCITIKIGYSCPDRRRKACMQIDEHTIYLPKWDKKAAGYVAQAFILMTMVERFDSRIAREIGQQLIDKDFQQYVDVY